VELLFTEGFLNVKFKDDRASLIYKGWFAWSPDSKRLAFIAGDGREATGNKRLSVIDLPDGRIEVWGSAGMVYTQPLWDSPPMRTDVSVVKTTSSSSSINWPINARFVHPSGMIRGRSCKPGGINWLVA